MSLTSSNGFEHPSIKSSSFRPKLFCSTLDKEFGPAIRPGHVIEVVGEAGSGKTQFGLHLSARAVAQELRVEDVNNDVKKTSDIRVLYLSTEGPFPICRLRQMIEGMGLSKQLMDKIFIENITTIVSREQENIYLDFLPKDFYINVLCSKIVYWKLILNFRRN